MARKYHERADYAWLYGVRARNHGEERVVPPFWDVYADAWLHGFDGEPIAGAGKPKLLATR